MGHTHVLEWRKFPGEKLYFNTGTWNPIPSVDAGMHESKQRLSYAKIELSADKQFIIRSSLNVWQGPMATFSRGSYSRGDLEINIKIINASTK